MSAAARRRAWRTLGAACVGIGAVNAFLPLAPTTVFWIIAAWAFGKSSPEAARRLLENPRFGPALRLWLEHRMMTRPAKLAAISALAASYALTLPLVGVNAVSLPLGAGLCLLAGYLATRREPALASQP